MDAEKEERVPVPLSAIGRSGTFIIDKSENVDVKKEEEPQETSTCVATEESQNLTSKTTDNAEDLEKPSENAATEVGSESADNEKVEITEITEENDANNLEEKVRISPVVATGSTPQGDLSEDEPPEPTRKEEVTIKEAETSKDPLVETKEGEKEKGKGDSNHVTPCTSEAISMVTSHEKVRSPVPAPRKTVVKSAHEKNIDKYLVMHQKLLQRWDAIANFPKFQPFETKTRIFLEQELTRRLKSHCPPEFERSPEEFSTNYRSIIQKTEEALHRLYNPDIRREDSNIAHDSNGETVTDLPTLRFMQWILPVLNAESLCLLFGCEIKCYATSC